MVNLTFGEQVKIVLSRKGMTIKELAEKMEKHTGKKMSRQNMTQRLGRDNFQEQDMRLIAELLGCDFKLDILEGIEELEGVQKELKFKETSREVKAETDSREVKFEDLVKKEVQVGALKELDAVAEEKPEAAQPEMKKPEFKKPEFKKPEFRKPEMRQNEIRKPELQKPELQPEQEVKRPAEPEKEPEKEKKVEGEINPYTGREYQTNSVRMHPRQIGFVQVYDQERHKWTDMTEWAFLGYQERKKLLLGKDYVPPIYLD